MWYIGFHLTYSVNRYEIKEKYLLRTFLLVYKLQPCPSKHVHSQAPFAGILYTLEWLHWTADSRMNTWVYMKSTQCSFV